MKVIDLLNKMANGEQLPNKILIRDVVYYLINDTYGNIVYSQTTDKKNWEAFIDRKLNITRCLHEDVIILDEVEIIEEQEEIDIQSIEDIKDIFIENSSCGEDVKYLARKYNEILKWAKQLDKKTKEKKQYNK